VKNRAPEKANKQKKNKLFPDFFFSNTGKVGLSLIFLSLAYLQVIKFLFAFQRKKQKINRQNFSENTEEKKHHKRTESPGEI